MATLLNPFLRADDANGNPVSGGQLAIFEAGTTTPVTTYSDRALTTAQAQPLVANSAGEFAQSFVASGIYKIRVSDADGVTLYENDNVRIADRPDDPVFFDTIALLLASTDTYATGTILITSKEGARYTALASGATNFSDENAGGQKLMRGYQVYETAADLISSVEPSRGTGAIWQARGFFYEEVSSGEHFSTSGSVKLKVLPADDGKYSANAFGAVGDWNGTTGTDDTSAIHLALDVASAIGAEIVFSPGVYRVTSGYTNDVNFADVKMSASLYTGEQSISAGSNFLRATTIVLDNESADSFFYKNAARNILTVQGMNFACAQIVTDRRFFVFSGGIANHHFLDCTFENVEKPINYIEGCYFQSSTIRNVQFRASGTIHSQVGGAGETNSLRATLLVLDNVHHETTVPANSDKIVCDLTGVRAVAATNFLLEGTGPGTDWTVLKLHNPHNSDWIRQPILSSQGFHIEFSGGAGIPGTYVHQIGGHVSIESPSGMWGPSSVYKLEDFATLTVKGATFSASTALLDTYFDIVDDNCRVYLNGCSGRSSPIDRRIEAVDFVRNSASDTYVSNASYSRNYAVSQWRWDGGFAPAIGGTVYQFSGTTSYPSIDATYGRKLVVVPNGNSINWQVRVPFVAPMTTKDTASVAVFLRAPTWTGGTGLSIQLLNNASTVGERVYLASSGELVDISGIRSLAGHGSATEWGIAVQSVGLSGVSGNLEIYGFELAQGNTEITTAQRVFPKNVITHNSAAPTLGEWARGDIVWNTTPAGGGVPGWVCVTAGTPGTWKAMASVAA